MGDALDSDDDSDGRMKHVEDGKGEFRWRRERRVKKEGEEGKRREVIRERIWQLMGIKKRQKRKMK